MTIYEAEMQCVSGSLMGLTFSRRYNDDSASQIVVWLDPDGDALKAAVFGGASYLNDALTMATSTWYKLRLVLVGSAVDVYCDTGSGLVYRASVFVQEESGIAYRFGLATWGNSAKFRNIKAWNANLSLPA